MKGFSMIPMLAGMAVGSAISAGSDFLKGSISNYYAEKRARDQAALEYAYAQRFAENSPLWNVKGLRAAGLNPILAASGGFSAPDWKPSSPSAPNTDSGVGIDSFEKMLSSRQSRDTAASQSELNISQTGLNESSSELNKANTAVKLLEAERIKQDLKGGGYKNPIVNDINRGMKDAAAALNNPSNSPTTQDSSASYIEVAPDNPKFSKKSFVGSVQARIDADNEVRRLTGKSIGEVRRMSDSEKIKILQDAKKKQLKPNKSRGYHIFTR